MRILVTNDDGILAQGIRAVSNHLVAAGHDVLVAAPDRNYSGCGTSLGPVGDGSVIHFDHIGNTEIAGARQVLAVQAPPAAIVLAVAQSGLDGWNPDWVVSGINNGFNTGRAALHSGTLSAALTAGSLGIPAIAVSAAVNADIGLSMAARIVTGLVGAEEAGAGVVNLNVPENRVPAGVVVAEPVGTSMTDMEYTRSGTSWVVRKVVAVDGFHPGGEGDALLRDYITLSSPAGPLGSEALAGARRIAEDAVAVHALNNSGPSSR